MMHSEGGITAQRGGMVICRNWELHNQGLSGASGAWKFFAPEGAISIGRGLQPPSPPPGSAPDCASHIFHPDTVTTRRIVEN